VEVVQVASETEEQEATERLLQIPFAEVLVAVVVQSRQVEVLVMLEQVVMDREALVVEEEEPVRTHQLEAVLAEAGATALSL
jgi:hypothetical protein